MADLREILVNWTTAAGGGFKTVTYWDDTHAINDQRQGLHDFLVAIRGQLANTVTFFQDQSGRVVDAGTGTLTGVWNDAEAFGNVGNGGAQCVSDATQVVVQWLTGAITNGRFIRGRSFIPGLVTTALSGGNLSPTAFGVFAPAAQALAAADLGLAVWHRPVLGTGGNFSEVIDANVWTELGVLRRRRT